ncbi:heme lyase CcmF/NrfE family subunit [Pelomonas sp. APW6]|uniref:Heme lyase CcmF/NrfE family subunit n=1 Tax=Roseateles subflavus TaxID=3053353 RepID=A0ABT7LFT7_9BURK|nr:heme lyase CcmF/NrfE family subunit [Pelomonas sp. APW6]MDL5031715.1 heme lyase CcmF/NrfE family subunit [Pelomonas sp. APW6]
MTAELGHLALWLALAASLVQGSLPLLGLARDRDDWQALVRPLAHGIATLVGLAFLALTACFVRDDFSVLYVAEHANTALPLAYKIAGVWGGHEGSLLLWLLMLQVWTVAVARFSAHLPPALVLRLLVVLSWVGTGFLLFMLLTSNPFERLWPVPPDGNDLNPLLQDPGMVIHPPMLYMGYVGFSVAFAFAIAALLSGELDARWARWTRPWTTVAWAFLTLGIALGSGWAYYELGWGGWWFWDPVENASFMPWLVGTALIHSLAVTEKRGAFKSWTVLLAILGFSLSLLGTFLVRSGVLSSVHAFASDPRRGLFILMFLGVTVGGALALYAWRAPKVGLGGRFALLSRETLLLLNNVMLLVATAAVMLGTLYPLVLDALGLGKISVGVPYFETVFVPLMAPLLFLVSVGPVAQWKKTELPQLTHRLRWALAVAVVAGLLASWRSGEMHWQAALGLALAFWILLGTLVELRPAGGAWRSLRQRSRAQWGMSLAHAGLAVFIIGVVMVKTYEEERDVRARSGDLITLRQHQFRFVGVRDVQGPNYVAAQAEVAVLREGQVLTVLHPEKRVYRVQRNPMTEAAIAPGLLGDLYVALGEELDDGSWTLRVYFKPFVDWIWGGCALMALGGLLAASDARYRRKAPQAAASTSPSLTLQGAQA